MKSKRIYGRSISLRTLRMLVSESHGIEEANAWNVLVPTVGYLFAASGPFILGYPRGVCGDFRPSIWLLVAVAVAMLLLTPYLQPHRHKE